MIRSLFIGFLILSALTSKGAEAQIVTSTNITPAMLRDIISAASACSEKSAVTSCDNGRVSCYNSLESGKSYLLSFNHNRSEVFIVTTPTDGDSCLKQCCGITDCGAVCTHNGMYSCMSGLSPPNKYTMSV